MHVLSGKQQFIIYSSQYLMFSSMDVSGGGIVIMGALMFGIALFANLMTFIRISLFYLVSTVMVVYSILFLFLEIKYER